MPPKLPTKKKGIRRKRTERRERYLKNHEDNQDKQARWRQRRAQSKPYLNMKMDCPPINTRFSDKNSAKLIAALIDDFTAECYEHLSGWFHGEGDMWYDDEETPKPCEAAKINWESFDWATDTVEGIGQLLVDEHFTPVYAANEDREHSALFDVTTIKQLFQQFNSISVPDTLLLTTAHVLSVLIAQKLPYTLPTLSILLFAFDRFRRFLDPMCGIISERVFVQRVLELQNGGWLTLHFIQPERELLGIYVRCGNDQRMGQGGHYFRNYIKASTSPHAITFRKIMRVSSNIMQM